MTQTELANKLFVTEKAVSRWETGRGTPDISLLIPLSKELNIDVSELLNGEENNIEKVIEYNEKSMKYKYNFQFKLIILFYILSILTFLFYLKFEYNPNIEINYFIRLSIIVIASLFIFIGNKIYSNNYVEKIEDKNKWLQKKVKAIYLEETYIRNTVSGVRAIPRYKELSIWGREYFKG